jgi:hypothetical protein
MTSATVASTQSNKRIQWMWNANYNPFLKSQTSEWAPYSDVLNMIIEEAFTNDEVHAILDDYHIDFKRQLQISNNDKSQQRPVKRMVCNIDDYHIREERFIFTSINPKRPFGGLYGWISPFIKKATKYLDITRDQLPSRDETIVPMVVEEAARGIVEEAKLIGKQCEGEKLAKILLEKKQAGIKEVWKCCAYLYSLESFLYKRLNEIMRLIGSEEHEQDWRNKVRTLGPFCLLLWDNPFDNNPTVRGTILYRGANFTDVLISSLQDDCSKSNKPIRSFQSFISCSRNRAKAEPFGNVLFIMEVKHAFTVNLQPFSKYPAEEEELLYPGVCFTVDRIEFDKHQNKHMINISLVQQYRRKLTCFSFIGFFIAIYSSQSLCFYLSSLRNFKTFS